MMPTNLPRSIASTMALSLAWSQKKPCEKFNLKMLKIMMKPIVNSRGAKEWGSNFLGKYLIFNIMYIHMYIHL